MTFFLGCVSYFISFNQKMILIGRVFPLLKSLKDMKRLARRLWKFYPVSQSSLSSLTLNFLAFFYSRSTVFWATILVNNVATTVLHFHLHSMLISKLVVLQSF